jgi:hypothetical protein
MATIDGIVTGLQIFAKHAGNGKLADVAAQHNIILICPDISKFIPTPEELAILDAAGWFFSSTDGCWAHFTYDLGESSCSTL